MNQYRKRLVAASLLEAFEQARASGDASRMTEVLVRGKFSQPEIESILWTKGDLGPDPVESSASDRVIWWVGQTVACALLAGLFSVYVAGGFSGTFSGSRYQQRLARERLMSDYRSPSEAYYRPFILGCAIGALLPLGYHVFRKTHEKNA